jgi:hypothetical protein
MADLIRQRRAAEEANIQASDTDRGKGHVLPSTFRVSAAVLPLAYAGLTFRMYWTMRKC